MNNEYNCECVDVYRLDSEAKLSFEDDRHSRHDVVEM